MIVPLREDLLATVPAGGLCVEVGTLDGAFAQLIFDIVKPARMILIDTWNDYHGSIGEESYRTTKKRFIGHPEVELWRGTSATRIPMLEDRSVNFAYIDADHEYEGCLADLEAILPKMAPGSWLCGHDYCCACCFGVVRAVTVFCERYKLSLGIMTDEPPKPWLTPTGNDPKEVSYNSYGIYIP